MKHKWNETEFNHLKKVKSGQRKASLTIHLCVILLVSWFEGNYKNKQMTTTDNSKLILFNELLNLTILLNLIKPQQGHNNIPVSYI